MPLVKVWCFNQRDTTDDTRILTARVNTQRVNEVGGVCTAYVTLVPLVCTVGACDVDHCAQVGVRCTEHPNLGVPTGEEGPVIPTDPPDSEGDPSSEELLRSLLAYYMAGRLDLTLEPESSQQVTAVLERSTDITCTAAPDEAGLSGVFAVFDG
jgi:hypothetical protein